MSVIEELLKHSKKHAQLISIILLGIIAAGSIAGGLWIQKLNSILAEKDKLETQRLALVEERYRNSLAATNLKYQGIELMLTKLEMSVNISTTRIAQLANDLDNFASVEMLESQNKNQLTSMSKRLFEQASQLSRDLEVSRKALHDEWEGQNRRYDKSQESRDSLAPLGRNYLLVLVILLLILVLIIILGVRRSVRNRRWKLAQQHLGKALSLLPEMPDDICRDMLYEHKKYMSRRDIGLAFYSLAVLGGVSSPPQIFWMELLSAAESTGDMQLTAKCRKWLSKGRA